MKKPFNITWRGLHRWLGLVMAVLMLVFCVSGLILNHRDLVSGCDVSRKLLPSSYRIKDYNNGVVRGTVRLGDDTVLLFGNAGIWLSDTSLADARDFNAGFPKGMDGRNVRNVVRTRTGELYAAAQAGLMRHDGEKWRPVGLPGNTERVTDVALLPDSAGVLALTRSDVYVKTANEAVFRNVGLTAPAGAKNEVTLFKTVWHLHSGQLFGLPGVLIVDALAIVLIFLSITGIVIFILPYSIRRSAVAKVKRQAGWLKWNFRWHNSVGYWTIGLTLLIAVTGACLRPPLMVPLVLNRSKAIPGTTLDHDNFWHDRLRAIRWDSMSGRWLLSTSEGFYMVDESFHAAPEPSGAKVTPPVSPMGVTVFEEMEPGKWLIGSFSGMYVWDMRSGRIHDWFTGQEYRKKKPGPPISDHLVAGFTRDVSGFTRDVSGGNIVVFDHYKGAVGLPEMPEELSRQPMSLWNVALEAHSGRLYDSLLGPVSVLFIFLAGASCVLVLVSGWKMARRRKKKKH